jgi:hypothetical protein
MKAEERQAKTEWERALHKRDVLFEVKNNIDKMLEENRGLVHETAQAYFKIRDARKAKRKEKKNKDKK